MEKPRLCNKRSIMIVAAMVLATSFLQYYRLNGFSLLFGSVHYVDRIVEYRGETYHNVLMHNEELFAPIQSMSSIAICDRGLYLGRIDGARYARVYELKGSGDDSNTRYLYVFWGRIMCEKELYISLGVGTAAGENTRRGKRRCEGLHQHCGDQEELRRMGNDVHRYGNMVEWGNLS